MMMATYSPSSRHPGGSALLSWLIALTISGYALVGVIVTALGVHGAVLTYPFRALVILLTIVGVAEVLRHRLPFRLDAALIIFWWIYLIRLVFDLGNPAFQRTELDLTFFVATSLIPALAVMVLAQSFDEGRTAQLLFYLGVLVSIGSLFFFLTGRVDAQLVANEGGRLQLEVLNPISLGHVGLTGVIAALVLWPRHRTVFGGRIALLGGSAIALFAMFLSGSRGPLLALAAALIAYSAMRGRWGQIFAIGVALAAALPGLMASDGLLIQRLTNTYIDASSQERLIYLASAVEQALANPVFGSSYVEPIFNEYPHNFVIESAMALGFGGLALFLFLCFRAAGQSMLGLRRGEVLLPLLFVQYIVAGQVSGALWSASPLWIVMAVLATLPRSSTPIGSDRSVTKSLSPATDRTGQ